MYSTNPFAVTTPENLSTDEARSLFVADVPGYRHLREAGHAFLNGARGSGKSMIFRYLEPDCQVLDNNCRLDELPFIAIYVPNKSPQTRPSELEAFSPSLLVYNEHALSLHILKHIIGALRDKIAVPLVNTLDHEQISALDRRFREFTIEDVFPRFIGSLWTGKIPVGIKDFGILDCLKSIDSALDGMSDLLVGHFKKQISAGTEGAVPYNGALIGFSDVVAPFVRGLSERKVFGSRQFFLLMDDADELNIAMTRILNGWLFARTTGYLSLKLSTAFRYKSYLTTNNRRVETPHDYAEINISDIYTSDKYQGYVSRLTKIIDRRLRLYKIDATPDDFFPEDDKQRSEINRISQRLREEWDQKGRGARSRDDSYRYAVAEYITGLAGKRKQSSKFSYSGFKMLVDISSGVVREFLDAATEMYDLSSARAAGSFVARIPPRIQNDVVRIRANKKIENIANELVGTRRCVDYSDADIASVKNLVFGLGALFKEILRSPRAERRVFSFAISGEADKSLQSILALAIEMGFLQTSTIGRKEGFGRTRLYVLTRLIAPEFNLDPSGFAGYKFLTSAKIWELMQNPTRVSNLLRTRTAEYFTTDDAVDLFNVSDIRPDAFGVDE